MNAGIDFWKFVVDARRPVSLLLQGALMVVGICALELLPAQAAVALPMVELHKSFVSFEPNLGQFDPRVSFRSHGTNYSLFLTPQNAVFALSEGGDPSRHSTVRMELVDSNRSPVLQGEDRLQGRMNYLTGSSPDNWKANVPLYRQVRYKAVYPGIDLIYYGNPQQLEYDFVVAPGADPNQIRLRFSGLSGVSLQADGSLELRTSSGRIVQNKPVVYQEHGGQRVPIPAAYHLIEPTPEDAPYELELAFSIDHYDARRPLIIDPVLAFSTYLGGEGGDLDGLDVITGLAVGADNSIFVSGTTYSPQFSAIVGPYQSAYGGSGDAFVAKLDANGALVYATYLGGRESDSAAEIAVDGEGNAYIVGKTWGGDFPLVDALYAEDYIGYQGFVAKLDPQGGSLVFSTYFADEVRDIALDSNANIVIGGLTSAGNLPVINAVQPSPISTEVLGFAAKLTANANELVFSTYIGGDEEFTETRVSAIAVDSEDKVLVGGQTEGGIPIANAVDSEVDPTLSDGFVVKLSGTGDLIFGTYLGADLSVDAVQSLAAGPNDSITATGVTTAEDFPTVGGLDVHKIPNDEAVDNYVAFISKLSSSGDQLVYSTLLGTPGEAAPLVHSCVVTIDPEGRAFVAGSSVIGYEPGSSSGAFPRINSLDESMSGDSGDGYLAAINAAGDELLFATLIGGEEFDELPNIALDATGSIIAGGSTQSADFPLVDPVDSDFQGEYEGVLVKVSDPLSGDGNGDDGGGGDDGGDGGDGGDDDGGDGGGVFSMLTLLLALVASVKRCTALSRRRAGMPDRTNATKKW